MLLASHRHPHHPARTHQKPPPPTTTSTETTLPGSLLLTVPRSAWLSSTAARTTSGVAPVLAARGEAVEAYCQPGSLWTVVLAVEHERHNASSHWRPYIDALPDPTSPVLWSESQLVPLESPTLTAEVRDLQSHINETYQRLVVPLFDKHPTVFNKGVNTLASFTWSTLTVWGRVFDLSRWNSTTKENGLMPLMDFANHRFRAKTPTSWDDTVFDFESDTVHGPGEELFISCVFSSEITQLLLHPTVLFCRQRPPRRECEHPIHY
jgi:hypothetical protein